MLARESVRNLPPGEGRCLGSALERIVDAALQFIQQILHSGQLSNIGAYIIDRYIVGDQLKK